MPEPSKFLNNVPVEITVSVGRARPAIREVLSMADGTILPLDKRMDDPVDLYIGEKLIARGVLEEIGEPGSGALGVRLTELFSESEAI
ncbi:MAG: hypothetical protein CMM86_05685 [Rhodovulum sp.]|jgi:flagellar motor switch protein FliN/FliY|nr:hypothetical protein [Rhodovulum sp.]|tara:strand:+ start:42 stop:305 length:264 start_codon:yes stop_codon:yes gene_type:complete